MLIVWKPLEVIRILYRTKTASLSPSKDSIELFAPRRDLRFQHRFTFDFKLSSLSGEIHRNENLWFGLRLSSKQETHDIEIIFLIASFHPCLSGVELYLNVQSLEDVGDIYDRVNLEVGDRDLGMTMQIEE